MKGQSDLKETFECIANVGTSGNTLLGQALVAPVPVVVAVVVMSGIEAKPVAVTGDGWQAASRSARVCRVCTTGP